MHLILNADDLGYSPAVNQAIFDLYDRGRLTSTSLVVNLPHGAEGMAGALARPGLKVGVHLNLTRGRPCSPPERIPTLVGPDGAFRSTPAFFTGAVAGRIDAAHLAVELRAQVERALATGLTLSHLDSHSHWHVLPGYNWAIKRLAQEYGIPRVRTANLRRTLLPNPLALGSAALAARPATSRPQQPDYLLSLHQWLRGTGQVSPLLFGPAVRRRLARPGVTAELVLHPGRADDPDFPPDTLSAERRQWETDFVRGPAFAEWLAAVGAENLK